MTSIIGSKKLGEWFILILLFALSFAYFCYGCQYFDFRTYHFDEGMSAYGAAQVLNGVLPYRDFSTYHMPGRFFILAGAFELFGTSLKTAVLFGVFIVTLTSCTIYLLSARVSSRVCAVLAYLLSLGLFKSYMVYNRTAQYAILFYIFAGFAMLNFLSLGKRRWLFAGGILTGFVGLFRIDFELFCLLSFSITVILKRIAEGRHGPAKKILAEGIKDIFILSAGFLLIFLPAFAYFVYYGGYQEFNSYILSGTWLKNRFLPFPALKAENLVFYTPAIVFLFTLAGMFFLKPAEKNKDKIFWLRIFLLLSLVFLYSYTFSRPDMPHLLATMVPSLILFAIFYDDIMTFLSRARHKSVYKGFIWGVSFAVCFLFIFVSFKQDLSDLRRLEQNSKRIAVPVPRAEGVYDSSGYARSYMRAISCVRDNTGAKEKIFVGNMRHDRVVNSDVMFYFLADRQSATRFFVLEPGYSNTERVQREIINDLSREKVRFVVLWTASEEVNEPNQSSESSGARDLDEFIRDNYYTYKIFGDYIILKRL